MSKKNIVLLCTKKGLPYAERIRDYLASLGINVYISEIGGLRDILKNNNLTAENTLIHSRTAGSATNEKIAEFEKTGFKVINCSRTLTLTSNKYLSQEHAKAHGIPVADTYKINRKDIAQAEFLLGKYGSLVLKPIFSQDRGVYCQKIDRGISKNDLGRILESVPGETIQAQQYINYKKLIRVIVIGYKALRAATVYDAPGNSWKCSVCLNPEIKKYNEQRDDLFELAEATARAFSAQINFIDFFEEISGRSGRREPSGRFILNEINTACNLLIHERITGCPIHRYIGDFLEHG